MARQKRILTQVSALLAASALGFVLPACGDDDGADTPTQNGSSAANRALPPGSVTTGGRGTAPTASEPGSVGEDGPAPDRAASNAGSVEADRAKAALTAIYRALRASDVAAVCEAMTPAAQRQLAASSPKKGQSCEQAFGRFYAFAERDNPRFRRALMARVIDAKVEGDRAVVAVRFPGRRSSRPVLMVKDGGSWKLPGVPTDKGD